MRKIYLDNIRWITVVLVVFYHVIYMYNSIEVIGVIGPFSEVQYQDVFQYLVYPWFMLILFVISGMCSRYYLDSNTSKDFIRSRTVKCLVPSTIGLFVFYWIQGYYNMCIGNAFESFPKSMPSILKYLIMSLSGIGQLWFIQLIWLYSVLLFLIIKIEKDRLYNLCEKTNVTVLILMCVVVYGMAQILNTPIITVYRFGIYGFGFFAGYFCFSHEEVMERLAKYYVVLSAVAIVLAVLFTVIYWRKPYAEASVLETPLCNLYAWIAILAIMSFMYRNGNFDNKFCRFMINQSWGLYLFHYMFIAIIAYYINIYAKGTPAIVCYIAVSVSAFVGSFITFEIIRRIPVIRFFVLGMKRKK